MLPFASITYIRHQIAEGEFGYNVTLNATGIANGTSSLTTQPAGGDKANVYDEVRESMK